MVMAAMPKGSEKPLGAVNGETFKR
jgi:hypothetical protein